MTFDGLKTPRLLTNLWMKVLEVQDLGFRVQGSGFKAKFIGTRNIKPFSKRYVCRSQGPGISGLQFGLRGLLDCCAGNLRILGPTLNRKDQGGGCLGFRGFRLGGSRVPGCRVYCSLFGGFGGLGVAGFRV